MEQLRIQGVLMPLNVPMACSESDGKAMTVMSLNVYVCNRRNVAFLFMYHCLYVVSVSATSQLVSQLDK